MKRVFFWGRLLLGAGLIAYLAYSTDLGELRRSVVTSSPLLLLVAYLIGIADRIWMAYKWNILLRARKVILSLSEATITYLMSTFLGLFLPSTVGGDAIRAVAVSRAGHAISDVASTIILERALGLLALMLMVIASILSGGLLIGARYLEDMANVLWVVAISGIVVGGLLMLSFNSLLKGHLETMMVNLPEQLSASKIGRMLSSLYDAYIEYRFQKKLLYLFFVYSVIENLFPIFWSYALAEAFQLQVSLLDCFVVVPSVLILRRLPLSIDGIGIHESAFVYLLALNGVPTSEGLLLGIATHLLAILLVLPGGVFYMIKGFDLTQIRKAEVT